MKKWKLFKIATTTFVVLTALSAQARLSDQEKSNTFVGNGGNAGDLELQMTLGQLKRISEKLATTADESICQCPPAYVGRPLCEPIQAMESKQAKFCAKILPEKAKEIHALLSPAGGIKFDWSDEKMTVIESDGAREAHAVANHDTRRIVINRDYFVGLTAPERVFLIAHELMHFTKVDGEYLRDDAPVQNFASRDGGRQFINSLSSSVATFGVAHGDYAQDLSANRRSKNYKNNWVTLGIGSGSGDETSEFAATRRAGAGIEFGRRVSERIGFFLRGRTFASDSGKTYLTETTLDSSESAGALGIQYRVMPFNNPMTYWGQSFLNFSLGAEYLKLNATLKDPYVTIEDEDDSIAALVRVQYYIPIVKGFWAMAEFAGTNHKYELEKINVQSRDIQAQAYLGVAYGF